MKRAILLIALVSLVALAVSFPVVLRATPQFHPVAARSCVDRYNSLLRSAKQALIAGDRATTADLLEEAKGIIPTCPALRDAGPPHAPQLAEKLASHPSGYACPREG
jgi:hypothetical protein